jgi:Flp pilus assembly protein TadG
LLGIFRALEHLAMPSFERFKRDNCGNVAVMFALALVPLLGAVGAAIDYSRVTEFRNQLIASLDAGVLAVGSQPQMTDTEAYTTVNDWVGTHMAQDAIGSWQLDSVTQNDQGEIVAMASGKVDTTIARVLGVTEIPISVTSEAVRSIGKVEVALVLDNTGSMRGTKIAKLKDAAGALIDTLAQATTNPDDLKIGLVPFSQTVNVGAQYANAAWLDVGGKSASAKSMFLGQEVNRFDLFNAVGKNWAGCVETRAMPYEPTETAPAASNPDTLYVPYFAPDEVGAKGVGNGKNDNPKYSNSYIADSSLKTIKKQLQNLGLTGVLTLPDFRLFEGDILKYKGTPATGTTSPMGYVYGPNAGCEIAPLLRLTSDPGEAKAAINNMIANGNTDIPIGATWGWNVLSDSGPFGDGVTYGTPNWTKIMVLMTDGNNENAVSDDTDLNASYYSGIGYVWQDRMGVPPDNTSKWDRTVARDDRLGQICDAMKQKGVVIYTIRVEVNNGSSDVLEKCASSDDKFYDVNDVAELTATFEKIGGSIQKLRLAQ